MQIFPALGGPAPAAQSAGAILSYIQTLIQFNLFSIQQIIKKDNYNIRLEGKFPPVYNRPAGYSMLAWEFDKTTSLDGYGAKSR